MPEGLVLGIPTEWKPFAETELFGLDTKLRALLEPIIPRKIFAGDDDESIASFVTRRLGSDICDRIAGPLLGGMVEMHDGRFDRILVVLFLFVEIADAGSVVDAGGPGDCAGEIQDAIDDRRLARRTMSAKNDIANIWHVVFGHSERSEWLLVNGEWFSELGRCWRPPGPRTG